MSEKEGEAPRSAGAIVLPSTLDAPAAAELRGRLVAALDEKGSIAIDAGAVDAMSTPAVQVLLAAALSCKQEDTGFSIVCASSSFRDAVADCGADSLLGMQGNEE